ncbi:MAG: hypothetical protein JWN44_973 [Myxococcales bacterium]|nr:hypothetical protein [Myxococcales bacterium]
MQDRNNWRATVTKVTLLHPQRFGVPPESIGELARSDRHWHLVRGQVLALRPAGSSALELPYDLAADPDEPAVLARIDVEETASWERPKLTTLERGCDFYVADAEGRALVRVADDAGRLHPDVELHIGAPFVEHTLHTHPTVVKAYVRAISVGDPIYVLGRSRLITHGGELLTGLRDAPLLPCFAADAGPLHLYDESAFRQLAAWYALPWYRKLSLLVRNR